MVYSRIHSSAMASLICWKMPLRAHFKTFQILNSLFYSLYHANQACRDNTIFSHTSKFHVTCAKNQKFWLHGLYFKLFTYNDSQYSMIVSLIQTCWQLNFDGTKSVNEATNITFQHGLKFCTCLYQKNTSNNRNFP